MDLIRDEGADTDLMFQFCLPKAAVCIESVNKKDSSLKDRLPFSLDDGSQNHICYYIFRSDNPDETRNILT